MTNPAVVGKRLTEASQDLVIKAKELRRSTQLFGFYSLAVLAECEHRSYPEQGPLGWSFGPINPRSIFSFFQKSSKSKPLGVVPICHNARVCDWMRVLV